MPHRLPALLEQAAQRVKLAARAATERTVEGLGLAALASANVFQRDGLLHAQFELNRKSAVFALTFNEAFDDRLRRECAPRGREGAQETNWDALSLVDDQEVERGVAAERFGLEVTHNCEWELRELEAYLGPLLGAAREANPLRPEAIGLAMLGGIDAVSDRAEIREVLRTELGRTLAREMQGTYQSIIAELRSAGVKPAGLTVRAQAEFCRYTSGYDTLDRAAGPDPQAHERVSSRSAGLGSHHGPISGAGRFGPSTGGGYPASRGTPLGQVDAQLMSLIRRLAYVEPMTGGGSGWSESASGHGMPGNLIRAHRDELRQASKGSLDHMVIDVIGMLFDQILSDSKVPPQMARQIARLQLPVLRAALGDPTFFSSRRHPVRRFVNRVASLGAGFEDFAEADARRFLERVKALVNDVVEGEFDQIEVYERKLHELEQFVAEMAREQVDAEGDTTHVLAEKETMLRIQQHYAQQLHGELKDLEGPEFVREFLTEVWSQVLVQAAQRHGVGSEPLKRLRACARELFMSVQPKGTPPQRKEFLQQLPRLMQSLNEGMDLIHWPESARKAFFGLLLPAHAESLKGQAMRTLDYNLLARRVEGAFNSAMPSAETLPPAAKELPVLNDAIVLPAFSAEEAARIGLIDESKVDWQQPVVEAPAAEPAVTVEDIGIQGLPAPDEVEPARGADLAEHVQLGVVYQMHIDDSWQKVKLSHVSAGRAFYVFTRGKRHQKTISMTHRMLVRLCETDRLRAIESAHLLERATARARRQLAELSAGR